MGSSPRRYVPFLQSGCAMVVEPGDKAEGESELDRR